MAEQQANPSGPDLAQGVSLSEFTGETLLGHVGDQDVLLVRAAGEVFAIDAHCSHYHGPLADGLVVGTASAAPGITPVSICAAAKPPARRRSIRFQSGRSSMRAIESWSGKSASSRSRAASSCRRCAGQDRHCRRRRGRVCRGRDAAAAAISRQHRDAEQRCRAAGGSAEPVKGLSRRQRARGLAAAAPGRILRGS